MASQKFTCPSVSAVPPACTVAVKVTTVSSGDRGHRISTRGKGESCGSGLGCPDRLDPTTPGHASDRKCTTKYIEWGWRVQPHKDSQKAQAADLLVDAGCPSA